MALALADGPGQLGRRLLVQHQVHVLQVLAEEPVEQPVLGAAVAVAEPPEPVAPLGDVQFFPRPGELLRPASTSAP